MSFTPISNINISQTLERRRQMAATIEQAIKSDPESFDKLISCVMQIYQSGNQPRLWDLLAVLSGNQRGFGNDWLFTALELRKQEDQSEKR